MSNPWKEIQLNDYENHKKLESDFQFQTLNNIMKEQLCAYDAKSVMILGVAAVSYTHLDVYKRQPLTV